MRKSQKEKTQKLGGGKMGSEKDLSNILSKVEEIKVREYQIKSLADLLVCKFQELVDSDRLESNEFSDPILSIAEMLREKADASLASIEEIEVIKMEFIELVNAGKTEALYSGATTTM
jgi:hypothetical protein